MHIQTTSHRLASLGSLCVLLPAAALMMKAPSSNPRDPKHGRGWSQGQILDAPNWQTFGLVFSRPADAVSTFKNFMNQSQTSDSSNKEVVQQGSQISTTLEPDEQSIHCQSGRARNCGQCPFARLCPSNLSNMPSRTATVNADSVSNGQSRPHSSPENQS